jgi:hypothetical protein
MADGVKKKPVQMASASWMGTSAVMGAAGGVVHGVMSWQEAKKVSGVSQMVRVYEFVARRTLDATAINPCLIKICWEATSSQGERPLEDEGKTSQKKRVVKFFKPQMHYSNVDDRLWCTLIARVDRCGPNFGHFCFRWKALLVKTVTITKLLIPPGKTAFFRGKICSA